MKLNHFDQDGKAVMVDVSDKTITRREAVAQGEIRVSPPVMAAIEQGTAAKGDVLGVARVAGIMAVKRTGELIPMCHPLMVTKCAVDFELEPDKGVVRAVCTACTDGKTGVEMEALTGAAVALLTIYDMCKALDKRMVIGDVHLVTKTGGKSGDFRFEGEQV